MAIGFLPWRQRQIIGDENLSGLDPNLKTLLVCGTALNRRFRSGLTVRDWLISRLLKVRTKDGKIAPLLANRTQREYSRTAGKRSIVLKARQMGMTTWIAARFFIATITQRGMLTVLVAHDQSSAESIFTIVHRFWENLPERLRAGALKPSRANVRQLVFPSLDSEYRVESAADGEAGRGLTIQNLHGSEVARWPGDAAATLASLRAAVVPHGEIVLESTARGAMGCFYHEWQHAIDTGCTQHFYPWWWEERYRERRAILLQDLSEAEQLLQQQHGLDDTQIAYRRQMIANFRGLARQEYAEDAESCFLRTGECVFEVDAVEHRLAECLRKEAAPQLTRFYPPQPGREYIIGVDSAGGGVDGDYACAEVIDRKSALQCAELHGHIPPQELAKKVAALAKEYNQALVAAERNNQGCEVLSCLWNVEKYKPVFAEGGHDGVLTTSRTKAEMIGMLAAMLAESPESFHSDRLLREMRTFVRQRNGGAAAGPGAHDDCVMAMGIALWVRDKEAGKPHGPGR